MSEDRLGDVPVYTYDPGARVTENGIDWDNVKRVEWLRNGEVIAIATLGEHVPAEDGGSWAVESFEYVTEEDA